MKKDFNNKLLKWFRENRRDLPWRGTTDPYKILVSEVMLQQTTASAVVGFYERFIDRFPSFESLANADEDEVLCMWSGLGYYRRAKMLRHAAQILKNHVPETRRELMSIRGIGSYTANALLSFSFSQALPTIDTNAIRVFSRLFMLNGGKSKIEKESYEMGTALISESSPSEWNQAIMELGSLICKNKNPLCSMCPVSSFCKAYQVGKVDQYPQTSKKKKMKKLTHVCICCVHGHKVSVSKIESGKWWAGMYEFPRFELSKSQSVHSFLESHKFNSARLLTKICHKVTHHKVSLYAYWINKRINEYKYVSYEKLDDYPMPSPQRKVAKELARILQYK